MSNRTLLPRWLLVAGALTYSTWPLAYLLRTGLGQGSSMTSDYEAAGHPWAWLFRSLDVVSGMLIGVGATVAIARLGWSRIALPTRIALAAAAIRGFGTALTGVVPTTCTAAARQCTKLHRTGWHGTWQDVVHHEVSGFSGTAMTIGVVALASGLFVGGIGKACRIIGPVLLLLLVVHELNVLGLLWSSTDQGVPQRLSELAEMIYFLAIAADLSSPAIRRQLVGALGSPPA